MTTALTWPEDARLALSIVVNVEEGAEMSIEDGDRRTGTGRRTRPRLEKTDP